MVWYICASSQSLFLTVSPLSQTRPAGRVLNNACRMSFKSGQYIDLGTLSTYLLSMVISCTCPSFRQDIPPFMIVLDVNKAGIFCWYSGTHLLECMQIPDDSSPTTWKACGDFWSYHTCNPSFFTINRCWSTCRAKVCIFTYLSDSCYHQCYDSEFPKCRRNDTGDHICCIFELQFIGPFTISTSWTFKILVLIRTESDVLYCRSP